MLGLERNDASIHSFITGCPSRLLMVWTSFVVNGYRKSYATPDCFILKLFNKLSNLQNNANQSRQNSVSYSWLITQIQRHWFFHPKAMVLQHWLQRGWKTNDVALLVGPQNCKQRCMFVLQFVVFAYTYVTRAVNDYEVWTGHKENYRSIIIRLLQWALSCTRYYTMRF